jgi:glutamate:GABA antiporter
MNNDSKRSPSSPKLLGVFSLVIITLGAVASMRNLPTIAAFGSSLIFFFLFAALFFLVPLSLTATELATMLPEEGGIYSWVKHAFGKPTGFLAIWLQWVGNIIWYPTVLSFAATTLGYVIAPDLDNNKVFLVATILISFWLVTLVNLLNIKASTMFNNICALVGLIFPMALIIWLGCKWYFTGNSPQINFDTHSLLANIDNPEMWAALTGIIMSFCGLEITTIHSTAVKTPHRTFPLALSVATLVLILVLLFGSLAIAMVLPEHQINMVAGVMQTFHAFFEIYSLQWIMPLVGVILVLGCLGSIGYWIIAPAKGLSIAAQDGHLPLYFARENKHRSPHVLLIYQAIVVSLVMLVFLLMPTVSASYWLLTAMSLQLFMAMYILIFAAGIVLRLKHPQKHRPFRIPGKKDLGMFMVAGTGIVCALLTFILGFFPPSLAAVGSLSNYITILLIGLVCLCAPPFIISYFYPKRSTTK